MSPQARLAAVPAADARSPVTDARPTAVVVLAAGQGTRMRSSTPKVLHALGGRTLLGHVLAAPSRSAPARTVVVVGAGRERGRGAPRPRSRPAPSRSSRTSSAAPGTRPRSRWTPCPTSTAPCWCSTATPRCCGRRRCARWSRRTGRRRGAHRAHRGAADPTGLGRIVRADAARSARSSRSATPPTSSGRSARSTPASTRSTPARCGTRWPGCPPPTRRARSTSPTSSACFVARRPAGRRASLAAGRGRPPGCNDRVELAAAHRMLNDRVLDELMRAGVTVVDPADHLGRRRRSTLAPDAVLQPGTQLHGRHRWRPARDVGPDCTLLDTAVGAGARVVRAHCTGAEIGPEATVGPFAYLRPGTRLGRGAKVGAFVEVEERRDRRGLEGAAPVLRRRRHHRRRARTSARRRSFVNYDGVAKHRTDDRRARPHRRDTMLVAPVTVGDGAYTAAGSVITADVPPGALAVARAPPAE